MQPVGPEDQETKANIIAMAKRIGLFFIRVFWEDRHYPHVY